MWTKQNQTSLVWITHYPNICGLVSFKGLGNFFRPALCSTNTAGLLVYGILHPQLLLLFLVIQENELVPQLRHFS